MNAIPRFSMYGCCKISWEQMAGTISIIFCKNNTDAEKKVCYTFSTTLSDGLLDFRHQT